MLHANQGEDLLEQEMAGPVFLSGVEEPHFHLRLFVEGGDMIALTYIARAASQRPIHLVIE